MTDESTMALIQISFDVQTKEFRCEGPMNDPALFLGMLELARSRFVVKMTMNEFSAAQARSKIAIVPGNKLPTH